MRLDKLETATNSLCIIYVARNDHKWSKVLSDINAVRNSKNYVRLITECNLPNEVLWKVSYSEHNIIQVNVDMLNPHTKWISTVMDRANRCGLYVVLTLINVIPEVVTQYQILRLIDQCRSFGYFHVNLRLATLDSTLYSINYLGNVLQQPTQKVSLIEWVQKIKAFTEPRNITLFICGENQNCTGLKETKPNGTN